MTPPQKAKGSGKNGRSQMSVTSAKMGTIPPASSFYHLKLTFLVSLLSWPVTYLFNNAFEKIDQTVRPFWMMASGFLILVSVVGGVAKYSINVNDWVYFGAVLFAFTAVIDLIITLEFNGLIHKFMSEYLKLGEPYLASPWGSAIALFDGIGFYFMYLALAHLIANGKSWRSLGIYWGAGIINSMIVLILGIFSGMHEPTFCTFLNVPYVVFPILALIRAFKTEARPTWNSSEPWLLKGVDFLLALCLGGCTYITLAKGFTALSPNNLGVDFLKFLEHEPSFLFEDPAPFPRIQALVYLLYLVPIQLVSMIFLATRQVPSFLWEITLVQAGVLIQGQFSVICLAFDPQTPTNYRTQFTDAYFWFYNLFLLIVPHVLLLRIKMFNVRYDERKTLKRT